MVIDGLLSTFNFTCISLIIIGTVLGIIFGAIPGLTSNMAVALCLPLTFTMEPLNGIAMLIALYVGGTSGGLISAVLLKIPGTPAAVATTFDGSPMAEKGEAGKALGVGIFFSFIGGILSIAALVFIAPSLAKVALAFGPYEYFAISIFALTMLGSLIGESIIKGLISAVFGVCLSLFGVAAIGGAHRFTFGISELENGFGLLPVLIGLFAVSEILKVAAEGLSNSKKTTFDYRIKGLGFSFAELKSQIGNSLRSALIGIGIGIMPGIGGSSSNLIAYSVAKQQSKNPEKFGTGCIEGVVASETANNASIGGALIPLLTLGIPGDTVTAMLLGGLTLHGIFPGPLLFKNSGVLVYGIFGAFLIAAVIVLLVQYYGMRFFVKILTVPKYILLPIIMTLCVVGTFGTNHRIFDVWTAFIFGLIGYGMSKFKFPLPPVILGFVLGPVIETNLIRGLMYSRNSFFEFLKNPISGAFLILSIIMVLYTVVKEIRKRRQCKI